MIAGILEETDVELKIGQIVWVYEEVTPENLFDHTYLKWFGKITHDYLLIKEHTFTFINKNCSAKELSVNECIYWKGERIVCK